MNLDQFVERVGDAQLPKADTEKARLVAPETVDALFHLPLLAVAIMTLARRAPFETANLGRYVAALMVEHFQALRRASHALETSLTLRRRCVEGLVFLEIMGLVTVSRDRKRTVTLTPTGKTKLDAARRGGNDLGLLIRSLRTSQDRSAARMGSL